MNIEQIYTGCLAQGAYYIESQGEVAIIDPLRGVQQYIDRAKSTNAEIKYIFESHFHADFVSGHISLAKRTGAPIIYGPLADPLFDAIIAKDGQEFKLGDVTIVVLHTPGHTMESTTYLLRDKEGKDHAIFSGDTLFLGDVGRPDLAQKSANMRLEDLAGILYDSLRTKIMPLADDVIVYPAHGAGSACGKNMMKETVDTLGNQKKMNYALRIDMTKEDFIREVTNGLAPPPAYFPANVKLNREGYADLRELIKSGGTPYGASEFKKKVEEKDVLMLDVRSTASYIKSHIPRSIFIGLDGSFAPWVGELVKDVEQEIILIVDEDRLEEAITRLSRVGFDRVIGYLKGGIASWEDNGYETDQMNSIGVEVFAERQKEGIPVIDARKPSEYQSEHILGAENYPLKDIGQHVSDLPEEEFALHCAGGYRSVIAGSILKSRGIHNMINIEGGYNKIKKTTIPRSEYVCPTTIT